MDLNSWLADVNGKTIDVDKAFGGQCWDLAQDYASRVCGAGTLNTQTGDYPRGLAGNVWSGFGRNGVENWFTQAPKTATMLPGWVPVWGIGVFTPSTHIAVGIKDNGASIDCMSQNPGQAHRTTLSKTGLLGYLVPKTGAAGSVVNTDFNPWVPWLNKDSADWLLNSGIAQQLAPLMQLGAFMEAVTAFFSDSGNWKRIGIFALGAILLLIVLWNLFGNDVVKGVQKVV